MENDGNTVSSAPELASPVPHARFGRTAWKYEGIAYALVLQEVGVLYEAMYLTATAMGLAPCARGFFDEHRFAKAVGIDPLAEAPVGGFLLGSRSDGSAPA